MKRKFTGTEVPVTISKAQFAVPHVRPVRTYGPRVRLVRTGLKWRYAAAMCYHRLNGSSSPVLTATSLSYGKAKNSTPTESKPLT